jgi:HEAT repeat protein
MGLVNPYMAHVRDIQPDANDRIHIVFDQVREREITGRVDDDRVRQLLLAATKDPTDPGIRVDSVEILKDQNGSDVRDALLYSARHDSNSAVRLKAVEGLRRFIDDPSTQGTLKFVLEHDDNPAIRSEAIDILAPSSGPVQFSPDLENTLHEIMRYESSDDYVRSRCLQILREMKASLDVY